MKILAITLWFSLNITGAWGQDVQGALSKVLTHHAHLIEFANKAQGNLDDMQLRALNNRLLEDYRIGRKTFIELAKDLNISVDPKVTGTDAPSIKSLNFDEAYIEFVEDEQKKILTLVQRKLLPALESSTFKKVAKNYVPRIDQILKNSQKLQNDLKKEKIK